MNRRILARKRSSAFVFSRILSLGVRFEIQEGSTYFRVSTGRHRQLSLNSYEAALCQSGSRSLNRYRKKLKRFFFSWFSGMPQAALAIWRIALEMGESSRARGVAVFWVRRAVA
jgi:hypothetical protein